MGMSTEDFEEQELFKICSLSTDHMNKVGITDNIDQATSLILILIKTLIENGTLTSKQVERALKESNKEPGQE